jgi:luciferase family oxidoreductase group 1
MRLSVLDQSASLSGRSQDASIRETLALAQHCEALGYDRFWVSEHHNHPAIVGSAPEILMAAIAATTRRIRIGSAGIMLPHYSALKVAEQFRVLEALAPGRIDMGLGRAPGSDRLTAYALNPRADSAADHFPAQVRDLMAWVADEPLPDAHPFRQIRAFPTGPFAPQAWILGSSDYGAQVAAHFGLPYCFAYFFTDGQGVESAMRLYRENYRPSALWPTPHAAICIWALAADSMEEAQRHFSSRALWRLLRDRNELGALPSVEEALAYPYSAADEARLAPMREIALIGRPSEVGSRMRALAAKLDVQELVVVTWAHDPAARRRSYELLAQEFALGGATPNFSAQGDSPSRIVG